MPRLLQASAGRARPVAEHGFQRWHAPGHRCRASTGLHACHLASAPPAGACRCLSRCDALRSAAQATYHEGLLGWLAEQAVAGAPACAHGWPERRNGGEAGAEGKAGARVQGRRSCLYCTTQAFAKRKFMNKTL